MSAAQPVCLRPNGWHHEDETGELHGPFPTRIYAEKMLSRYVRHHLEGLVPEPVPLLVVQVELYCPHCGARHVDETRNGERWDRRAHTTHRCQACGGDFDIYVSGAPGDVALPERSTTAGP